MSVLDQTKTKMTTAIEHFKNDFEKIYSIEIGEELANAARQRFTVNQNVEIVTGDSAEVLPSILRKLDKPALFWLDAHCSEGDTARGTDYSPITTELKIILSSPVKHTILIDDARLFDGVNYPTMRKIKRLVKNLRPDFSCFVENDLTHISPDDKN